MAEPLLLALDQGTTSTRAILFDRRGQPLQTATRPLRQSYPADGWVEHDALEIHRSCIEVLQEAVERSDRLWRTSPPWASPTSARRWWYGTRPPGSRSHPAIVWQDRRTADVRARLGDAEDEVAAVTGLLLDPYFSATKIAWLLDNVAGARARAERGELLCGTIDTWVVWKLTGGEVHATDATNASRTLLFDCRPRPGRRGCSPCLGFRPSCSAGEGHGRRLRRDLDGDPWPTGSHPRRGRRPARRPDGPGLHPRRRDEGHLWHGLFHAAAHGRRAPGPKARLLATMAARIGGKPSFALEGSIFVAGAAIQWLGEGLGVQGGPAAAEELARSARAGHGVTMTPAFTGLGAPWWDAGARGAIFGLTRDVGLAEIADAAYDACAFQTRDLIEAMRADVPHAFGAQSELRIDGGMASSPWFTQRLADLCGQKVQRVTYQEATALGAALFAGLGAGVFSSLEEAAAVRPQAEGFAPAMDVHAREAAYARWLDAVARTKS